MVLELDTLLQLLSITGYSIFSLIDDILARGEYEKEGIKLLQAGLTRDAVDICARLLSHKPASASISAWALDVVQPTLRSEAEEMYRKGHDIQNNTAASPGLSSGASSSWASIGDPESLCGMGQFIDYRHRANVDILPDNVFLEIFNFCLHDSDITENPLERTRRWQTLVHVCQRWRKIIFASPRGLDLHLSCSYGSPVRKNLVFWPVGLPLTVDYYPSRLHPIYGTNLPPDDEDNCLFALEHSRRVYRIKIHATRSLLTNVFIITQKSFPALTHLDLQWTDIDFSALFPVIPERFLSGSAPGLQYMHLRYISFPQLPAFLLSTRNLVTLKLKGISQSGYISPEAMVKGLAVLTRLTTFSISFCADISPPDQRTNHPDPQMRAILPTLTYFHYRGYSEFLEDLLAQVDTPQLNNVWIEYFMQQIQLEVPQLSQFIDRTENLKIDHFRDAKVTFYAEAISFVLNCPQGGYRQAQLSLNILDQEQLEIQVPCVAHVLGQLVATFSKVDHLTAHGDHVYSGEIGITEWLPFFCLFPAVETLHLSGGVAAYIASALEDTADAEEMVTDVFPALYLIWLEEGDEDDPESEDGYYDEPVGSIEGFLSLRQLSGRPVTVVDTQDEFFEADRNPL